MKTEKEIRKQLEAMLMIEFASMKAGVCKPNKALLLSLAKVIDYLKEREGED